MTKNRAEVGESATRRLIKQRSWGICEACGRRPAAHAAHRVGRGVGGTWDPANVLHLCAKCHMDDHAAPQAAYDAGLHLRGHQDPLREPVVLIHRGIKRKVLLDNQGGCLPVE